MNLMLDLETWGTSPGCGIRSIGAVTFALSGDHVEKSFYRNIDTNSSLYARLHIDEDTHHWWKTQSEEAQASLKVNPRPLAEVVVDFYNFATNLGAGSDLRVWSQGANFDVVLWEAAVRSLRTPRVPWKFYNCRDTRTLYELAGFDTKSVSRAGTYHNALDDARHQVECCRRAHAKLLAKTPELSGV